MKAYTIRNMPPDLHRDLKITAVKRGISMQQLLIDALYEWLQANYGEPERYREFQDAGKEE